ncbi:MAG TPA: hypothetical protein PKW29_07335, partial [Clostridia bacterium]|nr:hypothetical protein [Clostridia bacterium]
FVLWDVSQAHVFDTLGLENGLRVCLAVPSADLRDGYCIAPELVLYDGGKLIDRLPVFDREGWLIPCFAQCEKAEHGWLLLMDYEALYGTITPRNELVLVSKDGLKRVTRDNMVNALFVETDPSATICRDELLNHIADASYMYRYQYAASPEPEKWGALLEVSGPYRIAREANGIWSASFSYTLTNMTDCGGGCMLTNFYLRDRFTANYSEGDGKWHIASFGEAVPGEQDYFLGIELPYEHGFRGVGPTPDDAPVGGSFPCVTSDWRQITAESRIWYGTESAFQAGAGATAMPVAHRSRYACMAEQGTDFGVVRLDFETPVFFVAEAAISDLGKGRYSIEYYEKQIAEHTADELYATDLMKVYRAYMDMGYKIKKFASDAIDAFNWGNSLFLTFPGYAYCYLDEAGKPCAFRLKLSGGSVLFYEKDENGVLICGVAAQDFPNMVWDVENYERGDVVYDSQEENSVYQSNYKTNIVLRAAG